MALTHICCPYCSEEIRVELHIARADSEKGRGPLPVDLGEEIENFIVNGIEVEELSFREIGEKLMLRRVKTPRGGETWYPATVQRQYRKVVQRRTAERLERFGN